MLPIQYWVSFTSVQNKSVTLIYNNIVTKHSNQVINLQSRQPSTVHPSWGIRMSKYKLQISFVIRKTCVICCITVQRLISSDFSLWGCEITWNNVNLPPKTHAKAIPAKTVPSICKSGAINESDFIDVNNLKHCLTSSINK